MRFVTWLGDRIMLSIHLKPSYQLGVILISAHCLAALILWLLALPWQMQMILSVMLITSLIYYLRKDAYLSADNAIVALAFSSEISCTVTTRCGESIVCDVLHNSFVAPYLTVLDLKPAGKFLTCSVVILSDSIDAEEFRQLRVWLRWKWQTKK